MSKVAKLRNETSIMIDNIIHFFPKDWIEKLDKKFIIDMSGNKSVLKVFYKFPDHPYLNQEWVEVLDDTKIDFMEGMKFVTTNN